MNTRKLFHEEHKLADKLESKIFNTEVNGSAEFVDQFVRVFDRTRNEELHLELNAEDKELNQILNVNSFDFELRHVHVHDSGNFTVELEGFELFDKVEVTVKQ